MKKWDFQGNNSGVRHHMR